jgi:hypothetical protein
MSCKMMERRSEMAGYLERLTIHDDLGSWFGDSPGVGQSLVLTS